MGGRGEVLSPYRIVTVRPTAQAWMRRGHRPGFRRGLQATRGGMGRRLRPGESMPASVSQQ